MTITQTVEVTDNRRIYLDVPREVPTGTMQVVVRFPVKEKTPEPPNELTRAERAYAAHLRARKYCEELAEEVKNDPIFKKTGFGCLKDHIWIADDFCDPIDDFKDYM